MKIFPQDVTQAEWKFPAAMSITLYCARESINRGVACNSCDPMPTAYPSPIPHTRPSLVRTSPCLSPQATRMQHMSFSAGIGAMLVGEKRECVCEKKKIYIQGLFLEVEVQIVFHESPGVS